MHTAATVGQAFSLAGTGVRQAEIAERLGIGQSTISRWLRQGLDDTLGSPMRRTSGAECPDQCDLVVRAPAAPYSYLLGLYLGDGWISVGPRSVFRLAITCSAGYPRIIDECASAMQQVFPCNSIGRRRRDQVVDVNCYSKHIPCVFPQHGPGPKHRRPIRLEPWQRALALEAEPSRFIRGLLHSDGCRSLNRVRTPTVLSISMSAISSPTGPQTSGRSLERQAIAWGSLGGR